MRCKHLRPGLEQFGKKPDLGGIGDGLGGPCVIAVAGQQVARIRHLLDLVEKADDGEVQEDVDPFTDRGGAFPGIADSFYHPCRDQLHRRQHNLALVGKPRVKRLPGYPCLLGDVAHGRLARAVTGEHRNRTIKDLLVSLVHDKQLDNFC